MIAGNKLEDEGASFVGDMLRKNRALGHLNLEDNHISINGKLDDYISCAHAFMFAFYVCACVRVCIFVCLFVCSCVNCHFPSIHAYAVIFLYVY